jgi:hypothetical protein
MKKLPRCTSAAAVLVVILAACGGSDDSVATAEFEERIGRITGIDVHDAAVTANASVVIIADVGAIGDIDRSVTWTVDASSSGTIDATTGVYTAPSVAGVYKVWATSNADPTKTDYAWVTVTSSTSPPSTPPPPTGIVPAFAGAQGGAALTKGGRGGRVYEVTNLNDSGPGSLRACVAASGPRICVFRVGGTIQLASALVVTQPYLTVAGQTAPGGGIQISGKNLTDAVLGVWTHDVVWRYTRMRKGYNSATPRGTGGTVSLREGTYNVIFDHVSLTWTQDENFTVWAVRSPSPHSISLSWSIVAEPLGQHPMDIITGGQTRALADALVDVDMHHNFILNSGHRHPLSKDKRTRFVNNIVYNWATYPAQFGGGIWADVIGNVFKYGPLSRVGQHEIQVFPNGNATTANGSPSVYAVGNMGPSNSDPAADNWSSMVYEVTAEGGSEIGVLSSSYRRNAPLAPAGIPITADPASDLESMMLPTVGSSARLDCNGKWIPIRDSTDTRLVNEYNTNRGIVPTTEADVGGFPVIASGTACADTDHDGMPDAWETARGLIPNDASDGPRLLSDGYTNLDHYLNGAN